MTSNMAAPMMQDEDGIAKSNLKLLYALCTLNMPQNMPLITINPSALHMTLHIARLLDT